MLNKKTMMFAALAVAMPFFTFAGTTTATAGTLDSGLVTLGKWIGTLGQLIIAATVVAFFWGIFMFLFSEDKKDEAKGVMGWSIIGLFVMLSFWGIIGVMQKSTVGDDTSVKEQIGTIMPDIK